MFTSCEQEADVNIPVPKEVTIAYSSQSVLDTLSVFISKSLYIYDTASYIISDTSVEASIERNGIKTSLKLVADRYVAEDFKSNPGDSLVLQISRSGCEKATAFTKVPESIIPHSIEITAAALLIEEVYFSKVQLSFQDPANETNFYEFNISVTMIDNSSVNTIGYHQVKSFDPIIVNEDIMQYEPITILFSDALFNGSSVNIPMYYYLGFWPDNLQKVIVSSELRNVTKEHYDYFKTLYKYLYNESGIWQGMTQPVKLNGNVENGFGLFSVYTSSYDSIIYDFR